MDTDSIIQQTLKLSQLKIDSQIRSRTLLEWKQQALNGIKDDLTNFRWSFLSSASTATTAMYSKNTYNSTIATLTGMNSGAVTIATSVSSAIGTMKIGQIASIAQASNATSLWGVSKDGNGLRLTDTLGTLQLSDRSMQFNSNGDAKVNINGTNIVFNNAESKTYMNNDDYTDYTDWVNNTTGGSTPDTPDDVDYINYKMWQAGGRGNQITFNNQDSLGGNFARVMMNGKSIVVNQGDDLAAINEKAAGVYSGLTFDTYGRADVKINGVTIRLTKDMTVDDMMQAVNSSAAGVTMKYDRLSDQFTIESNQPGKSTVDIGSGLWALGIASGQYNNGTSARVMINNEWVERDTNSFDFRGVNITLNYTTEGTGAVDANGNHTWTAADDISVTTKRDATDAVARIKTYIDAYNTIVKKLEDLLAETKTKTEATYTPLTDEEKSTMTDKQISDWEAIAKIGILRNDSGIAGLTNALRSSLFDQVKSAGLTPSQIGLTTGRWDQGTGGQIILDEDKLTTALEDDPERVMNVFLGNTDPNAAYNEKGLMFRVNDLMLNYVNGSQSTSISNLESSISRANDQIDTLTQKMYDEQDKLYAKYAAMETALSTLQSQSSWLSSMLPTNSK